MIVWVFTLTLIAARHTITIVNMTRKSFQRYERAAKRLYTNDWHNSYIQTRKLNTIDTSKLVGERKYTVTIGEWEIRVSDGLFGYFVDSCQMRSSSVKKKKNICTVLVVGYVKALCITTSRQLIHTAWPIHTHTHCHHNHFAFFRAHSPFPSRSLSLSCTKHSSLSICVRVLLKFYSDSELMCSLSQWCNNTCEDLLHESRARSIQPRGKWRI